VQADDIESFTRQAEQAIQGLCPNAKIDSTLRDKLVAFRPKPGEADRMLPHLAIETLEGEGIPVLEDAFWNSKEARRNFLRQLGGYFAVNRLKPLVAYVVTEAWAKDWPKGEEPPTDLHLHEVKREIIIASALTIDRRAGVAMAEVLRDAEARISGYGEIETIACGSRQENGEPCTEAGILEPFFRGYVQALFNPAACTPRLEA
jgi:hypothetical protein